jgi:hypothetical protein
VVLLRAHALDEPPALDELAPHASPEMAALIARCLAKDPARRPGCGVLAEELRAIAEGEPTPAAIPAPEVVSTPERDEVSEPVLAPVARWRWPAIAAALGATAIALVGAAVALGSSNGQSLEAPAPALAPAPAPALAPAPDPDPEIEVAAEIEKAPAPAPRKRAKAAPRPARPAAAAKPKNEPKKDRKWGTLID